MGFLFGSVAARRFAVAGFKLFKLHKNLITINPGMIPSCLSHFPPKLCSWPLCRERRIPARESNLSNLSEGLRRTFFYRPCLELWGRFESVQKVSCKI